MIPEHWSFSSLTRDDTAERAQFHTNNHRWSWLIMHYRGGVLQFAFFSPFCYLASHVISPAFSYLSRSAFVFWISRIRGTVFRLAKFGRAFLLAQSGEDLYHCRFLFLGLGSLYIALLLLFNTPCATAVRLLDQPHCGWLFVSCHETTTILV